MSTVIINHLLAVLKFPISVPAFILYAKAILKAMTGNANFTSSAAKLTQLGIDITALDTAQTGLGTQPRSTTTATRDAALEVVKAGLRLLRNDVQAAADAKPALSESIIKSSAMGVKKQAVRQKRQNTVEDDVLPGDVILNAEGAGAHQWLQSPDEGVTIVHLDPTLTSTTEVKGLMPGVDVWFRNRRILPKGEYGEWTSWMLFTPKLR